MRKIITSLILLCLAISFSSCQTANSDKITMMVPFGSPQLSQLYLQASSEYYDVDVVSGPDLLVSAFASQSHDVIFAPTNLGARLHHNGSPYVLLATVVWGNFYVISQKIELSNFQDLDGKSITLFGQNQTADIVIRFLIDFFNMNVELNYVDSVQTAQGLLISGQSDIILTAEPSLSALRQNISQLSSIDIQKAYQEATQDTSYPQSGVFVHKDLSQEKINKLKEELKASIEQTNKHTTQAAELAVSLGIPFSVSILEMAIPQSNLLYVSGIDSRTSVERFFNLILETNPNMIGGKLPEAWFYL